MKRLLFSLALLFAVAFGTLSYGQIPGLFQPLLISATAQPDATIALTASSISSTNATVYDFGTLSIGTAATGRRIIVATGCGVTPSGTGRTVTLTVGGNSTTQVVSRTNPGSGNIGVAAIFIIQVDTGTTANVTATFSGACIDAGVGVWSAYNLTSSTATDTESSVSNPAVNTLNISAGGVAVGYYYLDGSATAWTNLTENFDTFSELDHSGASDAFATAQTARSITATGTGFSSGTLVLASFR